MLASIADYATVAVQLAFAGSLLAWCRFDRRRHERARALSQQFADRVQGRREKYERLEARVDGLISEAERVDASPRAPIPSVPSAPSEPRASLFASPPPSKETSPTP
jgi:hypothetical protein